mmetsp:Transcript_20298/g.24867  ORF Transcript_20298/g.24867 Transcript_20298/m.24867 type:complete len:154 (-) Transcript_20298:235-696(-)
MIVQVQVSIVITFLLRNAPLIISGPDDDKDDVKDDDAESKKFDDIDDKGDADDDDVLPEQQTPLELPESQPTPGTPRHPIFPCNPHLWTTPMKIHPSTQPLNTWLNICDEGVLVKEVVPLLLHECYGKRLPAKVRTLLAQQAVSRAALRTATP